jgi:GT2 family glycosyltransferase
MLLNSMPLDVLSPRAILLAEGIILLSLYGEVGAEASLFLGRQPPYGTVSVQSASGPHQIAAMRLSDYRASPANSLLRLTSDPTQDPDLIDLFNTVVLGSDITELVDELDTASQRRLLAFLLGFCGKAFELVDNPDFAISCLRLAQLCVPLCSTAEPVATVTASWLVLNGMLESPDASVFILSETRVRRSIAPPLSGFASLRLSEQVGPGEVLLVQGKQPARYIVSPVRAGVPDLVRTAPDAAGLRAACLRALAPVCPRVTAQIREMSLLAPAAPRRHDDASRPIGAGLEAALSDGQGRLFLRGWIRDPMHLVASTELAGSHGTAHLTASQLHRFRRPDLDKHFATAAFSSDEMRTGFVAYVDDPCGGHSLHPTLTLRLHSGARVEIRPSLRHPTAAVARTAVLTSVPPEDVTDAMLDDCLGPAAASFHRRSLEARGIPDRIQIGALSSDPAVSIIVPLYRNLSFLRFQVAALARDPECRAAELIVVLDSPEQRREAEHLLRGLHAMHGLSLTLLVMPRNLGYAAANNAGAAYARAPALLLLNSDVVPARPLWLGKLTAALAQTGVGAVGPKLLFDDESIQHAGLFFQRDLDGLWLNAHYHKGMPRAWPDAMLPRQVPGVTGAALLVHRSLFEAVGGICEDYIIGDYEDSDFCLRLHAAGASTMYVPAAELFHFERRSIGLHKGYAGTLACRYNRRLHHQRWSDTIAALMSEPEFGPSFVGAAA